jgi:hypothetical protein
MRRDSKSRGGKGFVDGDGDASVLCFRHALEVQELLRSIHESGSGNELRAIQGCGIAFTAWKLHFAIILGKVGLLIGIMKILS